MNIIQTVDVKRSEQFLRGLLDELESCGVFGVRFNFGRISDSSFLQMLERTINITKSTTSELRFIFDLPFPKRKSRIINISIEDQYVSYGKEYTITFDPKTFYLSNNCILMDKVDYPNLKADKIIYYGDGELGFEIVKQESSSELKVVALGSGNILPTRAINWGFSQSPKKLTYEAIDMIGKEERFDVAFSFVESPCDLPEFIGNYNGMFKIAKIETEAGVVSLDGIMKKTDGIMVARGDLGLNIRIEDFYSTIKNLVDNALAKNKRVFYATDILTSLEYKYFPCRADIMDVGLMKEMGCTDVVLPFRNELLPVILTLKKLI